MYKIISPKCKNGQLRNGNTLILDTVITYVDGVAEVGEDVFDKIWAALGEIPGYKYERNKPIKAKMNVVKDISEPEPEYPALTEITSDESDEPQPVKKFVGEMVSADNTASEIRAFAAAQNPAIDIHKCKSKADMVTVIRKALNL